MRPYAALADYAAVTAVPMVKHGEKRAHNRSQAVVLRKYGVIYRQASQDGAQ